MNQQNNMSEIGAEIRDPKGCVWEIINIWEYECPTTDKFYLCLCLIGIEGNPGAGKFGGLRLEEMEDKVAA